MNIKQNIRELASKSGWFVNEKTIARISKAKERFFGEDDWKKCPCYPPDDTIHGCGSKACSDDIRNNGMCHCNLFSTKEIKGGDYVTNAPNNFDGQPNLKTFFLMVRLQHQLHQRNKLL